MNIRPLEEQDVSQLVAYITELAAHHGDTSHVNEEAVHELCLGPDAWFVTLVAVRGNEVIGYVTLLRLGQLHFGAKGMELHHLYVQDGLRRAGVGRALVFAAEAKATELGAKFMVVGTEAENTAAHRFYEDIGFALRPDRGPRFSKRL